MTNTTPHRYFADVVDTERVCHRVYVDAVTSTAAKSAARKVVTGRGRKVLYVEGVYGA
jgi:hypothetical protein